MALRQTSMVYYKVIRIESFSEYWAKCLGADRAMLYGGCNCVKAEYQAQQTFAE